MNSLSVLGSVQNPWRQTIGLLAVAMMLSFSTACSSDEPPPAATTVTAAATYADGTLTLTSAASANKKAEQKFSGTAKIDDTTIQTGEGDDAEEVTFELAVATAGKVTFSSLAKLKEPLEDAANEDEADKTELVFTFTQGDDAKEVGAVTFKGAALQFLANHVVGGDDIKETFNDKSASEAEVSKLFDTVFGKFEKAE